MLLFVCKAFTIQIAKLLHTYNRLPVRFDSVLHLYIVILCCFVINQIKKDDNPDILIAS